MSCRPPRTILTAALAILLAGAPIGAASESAGRSAGPRSAPASEAQWRRIRPIAGEEQVHLIEPGETLHDVAYQHRLGFEAIARLNPTIDPWIPAPGTIVRLPTRYVLPPADASGIVINIPEMRLYDFTASDEVRVYAVAIGDRQDPTPIHSFRIGAKRINPVWTVPASIRAAKPELPARVPPGENNPLGSRWMTLGQSSYGIHGTNVRWSIGRDATHGCVRLYEDEMEGLFERTETGTPVRILYETVKWGTNGKDLFVEVHPDLYARVEDPIAYALALPGELGLLPHIDIERVRQAVERADGDPARVGALP